MDNLPLFDDARACYRADANDAEAGPFDDLQVHHAHGLLQSCIALDDLDATCSADTLFPSNECSHHGDTAAPSTLEHADGEVPSSQARCGCADQKQVKGDCQDGSCEGGAASSAGIPGTSAAALGGGNDVGIGIDFGDWTNEKLHELNARRRRCCGDVCTCAISCNCVDESAKCCDVDDEVLGWLQETIGSPNVQETAIPTAATPTESKPTAQEPSSERKVAVAAPTLEANAASAPSLENPSTLAHVISPVISPVDTPVHEDETGPSQGQQSRIDKGTWDKKCCSTHMAESRMLYSTAATTAAPLVSASANIPAHCGRTNEEAGLGYTCAPCGKRFDTQDKYEMHNAKVHHAPRPYMCNRCGATFLFKQNRDRHVVEVHEGKRPHKCPHANCKAAFKNSSGLKQHIRTVHDKQRPFKCPHCPSSFGQRNHLSQHILVVHERCKLFECDECGSHFSNRGNLNQHKRRKHKKKEDDDEASNKKPKSKHRCKRPPIEKAKTSVELLSPNDITSGSDLPIEKATSCAEHVQANDICTTQ